MDNIKVKHTSIMIPNYNLGDKDSLEKLLSVWNDSYYRYEPIGYVYNEDKKELIVPRGLDLSYLEKLFGANLEVDYKPDPYEVASYRLKKEPRNDIQKKSISYLLGEGDFSYTKKYSQLTLNLDTGDGKTYCVIAYLTFNKTNSMVITPIDGIKTQWYTSFKQFTDLDDRYICDIDGSAVVNRLLKSNNLKYKVYLVNHRTLYSYAKKNGWDKITELFQKLKIGVKVFDEAHLEFENMMRVDLNTNTKKTIYLTANFERTEHKENKLFKLCFKNIAKYGVETRNEKRKHIVYIGVLFNSKPNLDVQASMIGLHGFDKNKYIDYQLKRDNLFKVVIYLLNYFRDKEGKTLILSSKIDSTEVIYNYLIENYPEKTVGLYNSQLTDEEKMKSKTCDIISSTPKSVGTGIDIPGLRFEINSEPYSSKITANQIAGRLREYGEDAYTFYIELVDTGFKRVNEMYKKRLPIFKQKCTKVLELQYKDVE